MHNQSAGHMLSGDVVLDWGVEFLNPDAQL